MEFFLDPKRLEQRNENVQVQLRHVRHFLKLIEQSKEYDTMHQKELTRIQQRLTRMERNLSQLITVTDDALAEYRMLEHQMQDSMEQIRHDSSKIFK